jgi:exosortase/archaeosortase family protein
VNSGVFEIGNRVPNSEPMSRPGMFGTLYLIAIANGLTGDIADTIRAEGLQAALGATFGVSIVTLAATAAGAHLMARSRPVPFRRVDGIAAATVALLLLMPHPAGSWLAATALALFALGRDRDCPYNVAAASVFLAIATGEFWSRIAVQTFAAPLLAWDAALVAGVLDVFTTRAVERVGNLIVAGDMSLAILAGCSSVINVTYGLLVWIGVARMLRPEWQRKDLLTAFVVAVTVVAANVLRMTIMAWSAEAYDWMHGAAGADLFNLGLLLFAATVALLSTRPTTALVARECLRPHGLEPHR